MKCFSNNTEEDYFWRTKSEEGRLPEKISSGSRVSQNYRVNDSFPGQYDLIFDASLSTGNQYICQEGPHGLKDGNFSSAELMVLESDPKCATGNNSNGSGVIVIPMKYSLKLQCSVTYSGNWKPTAEWTGQNSTTFESKARNDSVNLTTIITVPHDDIIHGSMYIYKLLFKESNRPPSTTANNLPDYHYTWISPVILIADSTEADSENVTIQTAAPEIGDTPILLSIWATSLIVLVVLILLPVVIKKFKRSRQRISGTNVFSPGVGTSTNQEPVYLEVIAESSSTFDYTSLQRDRQPTVFALNNLYMENAAYTQLRQVSSSNQTDSGSMVELDN